MFNIVRENDNVVIKFSLNNGNYDQKNNYKIDLSNRVYYLMDSNEWVELDWELAIESIEDRMEDIKREIELKIFNNKSVIYSYKMDERRKGIDCSKQIAKANKHKEDNLIIQEFLNNYTL
jgi:hypothetical protein